MGRKSLNYIDGMWRCSNFRQDKERKVLSRDYLGQKKKVYIINAKKKILFSSQLKGIIQDKSFTREIDNESVKNFFSPRF